MLEELFTPKYEKLVKEFERTPHFRCFLTHQECSLSGSTNYDKYVTDHYTVLRYLRSKKRSEMQIKRIKNEREKLKYSIAYISNFKIPEEEMQRLLLSNRCKVLIKLPLIDDHGRTLFDPEVVDENYNIVHVPKKQREFVKWRNVNKYSLV